MLGCPKLTPLQSRFAASAAALALIALIYWSISSPVFAYAAELAVDGAGVSRNTEDHNWERIREERLAEDGVDVDLDTRAAAQAIMENNYGNALNINPGETHVWSYPATLLYGPYSPKVPGLPANDVEEARADLRHEDLRKRGDDGLEERQQGAQNGTRQIFISINTCQQPTWSGTGTQTSAPPQLTLYVSTTASNKNPGPGGDADAQHVLPMQNGFANSTVNATGEWYMSVHAPAKPDGFQGIWNYELAVSIDDYFHKAHPFPNLFLIDSDSDSSLLVTDNLTQSGPDSTSYKEWMSLPRPPYFMFASNSEYTPTLGLESSYCGLNKVAQIGSNQGINATTEHIQTEMITRGLGQKPKEQFYVTSLNRSGSYTAMLALNGNSTDAGNGVVGGGGSVWAPVNFNTKSDGNCALLFNLSFCEDVAYAVPFNPRNATNFADFYDDYTLRNYQKFNYSLQQIPCDTTAAAQYSLAVDCADCAAAYKEWLCAVSIPRCTDFSRPNTDTWLMPRNMAQAAWYNNGTYLPSTLLNSAFIPMPSAPTLEGSPAFSQTYLSSLATNSSRNPGIDSEIAPGPYKEVLPCQDICYNLAKSCPAALGFTCPYPGRGLEMGYGRQNPTGNGTITCNYPGAYVSYSAGHRSIGPVSWALVLVVAGVMILSGLV